MFTTQREAKQFFVDKVIDQATSERMSLSDAERGMLRWSETDPDTKLTPEQMRALADDLASQMSDEEYESKIAGLLSRAYAHDDGLGAGRDELWRQAYSKLKEGDHYIAIMLDRALGRVLRKRWFSWLRHT